tara:strand:+ start:59 stop:769 length:711 start_codon:yes stop_codon:yes gene_type:complete
MAVSVDTVYQRVLTLANKEQRGYITPQEFNLLANQAQLEILNQYFYDINQWNAKHGNSHEYSDMISLINEKIAIFNVRDLNVIVTNGIFPIVGNTSLSFNVYKIGSVFENTRQVEIEEVNYNEYQTMQLGPLTRPTETRPVYVNRIDGINIYPNTGIKSIDIQYIKVPNTVQWGYVVVNEKALYNDNTAQNFELHGSEETELVFKILKLAGITMKNAEVVQVGGALEQGQIQQEKQ